MQNADFSFLLIINYNNNNEKIIKFYREIWQNAHCFPNTLITQWLSV